LGRLGRAERCDGGWTAFHHYSYAFAGYPRVRTWIYDWLIRRLSGSCGVGGRLRWEMEYYDGEVARYTRANHQGNNSCRRMMESFVVTAVVDRP
jgi:hypothetical protein